MRLDDDRLLGPPVQRIRSAATSAHLQPAWRAIADVERVIEVGEHRIRAIDPSPDQPGDAGTTGAAPSGPSSGHVRVDRGPRPRLCGSPPCPPTSLPGSSQRAASRAAELLQVALCWRRAVATYDQHDRAGLAPPSITDHIGSTTKERTMAFELPALPYARTTVPVIPPETIDYHYGKYGRTVN
jgi:hypothetical protein